MIAPQVESFSETAGTPLAQSAYLRLSRTLRSGDFAGWDPYDALSAEWLCALTRTALLRRVAIQGVKRAPVNVRPLLGVKQLRHTKGLALCASAYARMASAELDPQARDIATKLALELTRRAIPRADGVGWGYDFDVQTRWGYYRRGTPNAVVTTFAAHALLDVAELDDDDELRQTALRAVPYACSQLAVHREGGERYFAYFTGSCVPIHNANLLVASMVGRCAEKNSEAHRMAQAAMAYTLRRQGPDGSWPYGEAQGLEWVDGFHTAYLLGDLDRWLEQMQPGVEDDAQEPGAVEDTAELATVENAGEPAAAEDAIENALRRGLDLYLTRLIDPDGAPRASLSSRYPIDIHACATAISTLSRLARWDSRAAAAAQRVLDWTLEHMARPDGRFAFQRHRHRRDSTAYVRWGDAHMLLALADCVASRGPSLSSSLTV